jgi:aminoglycoside phosphotransferase family enzyme/predicted kinase
VAGERTRAAVVETHVSVVVFIGDRVYKLKKPVAPGFLDYSTRAAREAACHEEVSLNRRFAPDVYLGVADVHGPGGEVCDHLVVMRRLPDDRRLATLVTGGVDVDDPLWAVAHRMAMVHAATPTSAAIAATATLDAVRRRWEDNFASMAPFVGPVLDERTADGVAWLARRYLAGRSALFTARIRDGRIRDGHGDLLAEDIFCLEDGPRILDCLEFDPGLRWGDVLADVAFLAMDLEHLGRPDLASRFLDAYRELSAENWPSSLADHYIAYRAHVRSKVMCMRHAQGDQTAAEAAADLLDLARAHLERGRVRLVLVGGLPGSGKSTLAGALADAGVGMILRSDQTRKELAGLDPTTPAPADFEEGIYRPDATEATYRELGRRAGRLLAMGESVVLDATWRSATHRAAAHRVAAQAAADLIELRCVAPTAVAACRLNDPAHRRSSDADPAIARAMTAAYDPWPSASPIDTTGPVHESLGAGLRAVRGWPAPARPGPGPEDAKDRVPS